MSSSVCNKQRRSAVIEQLVSLALQSAVVMLIVSLTVMVMQEINDTTFFTNTFMNLITKSLLYLGCATFIMTGSQVINCFIGTNISLASGREQLMSLMGYGKMVGSQALSQAGIAIGSMGLNSDSGQSPTRMQRFANAMETKMYMAGQKNISNKFSASDAFINAGVSSLNSTVRKVMPRAIYNPSYYRRKNNMI